MIFIAGILFIVIGIVLSVKFFLNNRRPKVSAKVLGLLKEAPAGQFIEQPHALVEYEFQGMKHTGKVLLRTKPQVGESITLAVKPESPTKAVEYSPKKEVISIIACFVLGIGMMAGSYILTDGFSS